MSSVAALVTLSDDRVIGETLPALATCGLIDDIAVVVPPGQFCSKGTSNVLVADSLWSIGTVADILRWLEATTAEYLLWVFSGAPMVYSAGVARMVQVATDAGAACTYSDYFDFAAGGTTRNHPLIDYQPGSIRDDFDFGAMALLDRKQAIAQVGRLTEGLTWGGWYDLRLRLSEAGSVVRIPEPLYVLPETNTRASGEKVFDYVDPRKRDYQSEMERVVTNHLERIGALLAPPSDPLVEDHRKYPVAASVVIPVRNRVGTIRDAVTIALAQEAPFEFNVIVVDNHSSDGTTDALQEMACADPRLIHVQPERVDLGIGGCWNEAVFSPRCGRIAVQLDSDDTYDGANVLARIVAEFSRAPYAVVVGSYTTVSFELEPLPPGLVDHREWNDQNGHNNALRIAGLGAPRAFHVPTLRSIGFPNVSYGEDYAVVLRLSRSYRVGRIYDSLYWCRRWEGNTDSALPLETSNRYHAYKDRLRTIEIAARQRIAGRQ